METMDLGDEGKVISIELEEKNYWMKLPKDCKNLLFSFVDFWDFKTITLVSKEWRDFLQDNELFFKSQCYKLWDVKVLDVDVKSWKESLKQIGKIIN